MLVTIATWFLIFMFYSFMGWLVEVIISLLEHRKFINRGFLVGPICPIYGVGAVLLSILLHATNTTNPLIIFCVGFVGGAVLEYTSSYWMEKLFRVRWWDYSNQPFNVNGRICLGAEVCFGLIGILIARISTPMLMGIIGSLNVVALYIIAGILALWLIADIVLSLWLILGVRVTVGIVARDATDEISTRVREVLMDKGKLNQRLVKAFPHQSPSKKPVHRTKKKS